MTSIHPSTSPGDNCRSLFPRPHLYGYIGHSSPRSLDSRTNRSEENSVRRCHKLQSRKQKFFRRAWELLNFHTIDLRNFSFAKSNSCVDDHSSPEGVSVHENIIRRNAFSLKLSKFPEQDLGDRFPVEKYDGFVVDIVGVLPPIKGNHATPAVFQEFSC